MLKRVDHIAIIVRNIEQALVFYRDTLGIMPGEIKEVPTEQVRIAFLPMGGPGGSEIELIEPTSANSSLSKFLEKRGEGLHHICLEVDDIDAALAEMQEKGTPVLDKEPRIAAEGRAIFIHPKAANGVLLELVERDFNLIFVVHQSSHRDILVNCFRMDNTPPINSHCWRLSQRDIPMLLRWIRIPFILQHLQGGNQL